MDNYDVIIVGAGAAGLLAAGRAAELGAKILILEKMNGPGKKLSITGKGRCNITNEASISEFIKHVYPNGKFLKSVFSKFYNQDIINLLTNLGVNITLERGGRYFPTSNKASDILNALLKWLQSENITFLYNYKVEKLLINNNEVEGVKANGKDFNANNVILATGGKSYPATGSTGDGYILAQQASHSISEVYPALVPLETDGTITKQLQGLNLKNVTAVLWLNGKKIKEEFGEVHLTSYGLSGPIILTLSRLVVQELQKKHDVEITIDLKPALDDQKLDLRLQRDLNANGKKKLENVFKLWLPAKLIPVFFSILNLNPEKECHQVSAKERKQIRNLMKSFTFKITKHRSYNEAIITAGGIRTNEISQKTMESKLCKGLYFAGEIIDLDAETGGYNLQIAFSTGWLAGNSIIS